MINYYLLHLTKIDTKHLLLFLQVQEKSYRKPTDFFFSSALRYSNISSGFIPEALLEDLIEGIRFLEVVLMQLMLE